MSITLSPELEALVEDRVKSGIYQNTEEVLLQGLLLLKDRDEESAELREMIRESDEALERGEYDDYDEDSLLQLAEDIKARGRMGLAALQKQDV
jgi:antitoxin ParD1/3/4